VGTVPPATVRGGVLLSGGAVGRRTAVHAGEAALPALLFVV